MKRPHTPTPRPVNGKVKKCPKCSWTGRGLTEHLATEHRTGWRVEDPEPFDEFTGPWAPMRRSDA